MNLAPIVLFVYNRPWHTRQTIESLQANELASESELYIYSDAPKDSMSLSNVKEVRSYIHSINGFKKITIIEREKNWGLANSIIDGVTNIVNQYGKVIVLEDDLVTSPYFLRFMNEALSFYKDKQKVWHISGWNYPINTDDLGDVFMWRLMNCWGWATWADRWQHFEKNTDKLIKEFSKSDINAFNLNGTEIFWNQVLLNKKKRINTWAIYWYANILKKEGLCVNPAQAFVKNIGNDGTGVNCDATDIFESKVSLKKEIYFSTEYIESKLAIERVKYFYKKSRTPILIKIKTVIKYIISKRHK